MTPKVSPPTENVAMPVSLMAGVSVNEASKLVGVSSSTLRRMIDDGRIGTYREGRRIKLTQSTVLELQSGSIQKPSVTQRFVDQERGAIAKQAFPLFAQQAQLIDVVIELGVDPPVVGKLWDEWLALQEKQRRAIIPHCLHHGPECDGSPLPAIGLCKVHYPRSRLLTNEEWALVQAHRRLKQEEAR